KQVVIDKVNEINKKYEDSKNENGESPYYYPDFTIRILQELLGGKKIEMCRYCDSNILDALAINSKDEAVIINQDTETGEYFIDGLDERVYIDYCPMCRKEARRVKVIF